MNTNIGRLSIIGLPSQFFFVPLFVVDEAQGFLEAFVVVVDDLEVFGHIIQVACDKRLDLEHDERLGTVVLLFVELDLVVLASVTSSCIMSSVTLKFCLYWANFGYFLFSSAR